MWEALSWLDILFVFSVITENQKNSSKMSQVLLVVRESQLV